MTTHRLSRTGFGLALLILSIIAVTTYRSLTGFIDASLSVDKSYQVIALLQNLATEVATVESSARGYVVTGKDFQLEPYYAAEKRVNAMIRDLWAAAGDDARLHRWIGGIQRTVADKLAYHRRMIALRREKGLIASGEALLTGEGHELMDMIRTSITDMITEESGLLRQRTEHAHRHAEGAIVTLLVGTLFGFALLVLVYVGLENEAEDRRRSQENLIRMNRLYAVLSQVSQAIVRVRDRVELMQELCRIAVAEGRFPMAWVGHVDQPAGFISIAAECGAADYLSKICISAGEGSDGQGPAGECARSGKRVLCNDVQAEPRMLPWREELTRRGYHSSAAFPIFVEGTMVAVFSVYAGETGFFDESNVTLLDEVTADVGLALERMEQEYRRRQAEEQLRFHGQIIDQVHDSVISTDLDGLVTSWNKGAERFTGYARDEALGRHISFLYPEEERGFLENAVIQPLKATGSHEAEVRMRRKSGRDVYAHLSLSMLRDNSGNPVGMIGYSLDITTRKAAEEEIRKLNESLERRVEERTLELNRANQELRQASRLKSDFLARMSHELRTPMNAIVGFADLLAEEGDGPIGDTYRHFVRHIQGGSRHLVHLINDSLDLSRIEAGHLELRPEVFHPSDAIEEVCSVIAPLAETRNIEVIRQVPSSLNVHADRTRFKQILYNLLSNAVKFTPEGGHARVDCLHDPDQLCFVVSDTGAGIPPAELEAVFEPFHQVPGEKDAREGTGLGLSITRKLVEQHGGRIWVESAAGLGSRFFFTLPPGPGEDAGNVARDALVLVAGRDTRASAAVADCLRQEGYRVTAEADAGDANLFARVVACPEGGLETTDPAAGPAVTVWLDPRREVGVAICSAALLDKSRVETCYEAVRQFLGDGDVVLVASDPAAARALSRLSLEAGHTPLPVHTTGEVLELLAARPVDAILLDLGAAAIETAPVLRRIRGDRELDGLLVFPLLEPNVPPAMTAAWRDELIAEIGRAAAGDYAKTTHSGR